MWAARAVASGMVFMIVRTIGSGVLHGGYGCGGEYGYREAVRAVGGCWITWHYCGRVRAQHLLLFSKLSNTCDKELSVGGVHGHRQRLVGTQRLLTIVWIRSRRSTAPWRSAGCIGPNAPSAILARGIVGLTVGPLACAFGRFKAFLAQVNPLPHSGLLQHMEPTLSTIMADDCNRWILEAMRWLVIAKVWTTISVISLLALTCRTTLTVAYNVTCSQTSCNGMGACNSKATKQHSLSINTKVCSP